MARGLCARRALVTLPPRPKKLRASPQRIGTGRCPRQAQYRTLGASSTPEETPGRPAVPPRGQARSRAGYWPPSCRAGWRAPWSHHPLDPSQSLYSAPRVLPGAAYVRSGRYDNLFLDFIFK
jgi:hypothetical protein